MEKFFKIIASIFLSIVALYSVLNSLRRNGFLRKVLMRLSGLFAHPILDRLYEANGFKRIEETHKKDEPDIL